MFRICFSFKWKFDESDESLAAGVFIDLVMKEKVDIVIGPPGSNSKYIIVFTALSVPVTVLCFSLSSLFKGRCTVRAQVTPLSML